MCKALLEIMEPEINEIVGAATKEAVEKTARETARETAKRMIRKGKMTVEEIAEYVPSLSVNELKKLEAEIMQMA